MNNGQGLNTANVVRVRPRTAFGEEWVETMIAKFRDSRSSLATDSMDGCDRQASVGLPVDLDKESNVRRLQNLKTWSETLQMLIGADGLDVFLGGWQANVGLDFLQPLQRRFLKRNG